MEVINVHFGEMWESLNDHLVFPSEGYEKEFKNILKKYYYAKVSTKSITFIDRRG